MSTVYVGGASCFAVANSMPPLSHYLKELVEINRGVEESKEFTELHCNDGRVLVHKEFASIFKLP